MNDTTTQKPLTVSTEGTAGPYIMVPETQLEAVCQLLDANGIPYWVEEEVISLNGGPEIGVVNLGRGGDAQLVQSMLDSAS